MLCRFFFLFIFFYVQESCWATESNPDLVSALHTSSSGMKVQAQRLKVVAENIANQNSVAVTPEGLPYLRKQIYFKNVYDPELKAYVVKVFRQTRDYEDIPFRYEPKHPAADTYGYVKYPNVDNIIEIADQKEASTSYNANLQVANLSKNLIQKTLTIIEK